MSDFLQHLSNLFAEENHWRWLIAFVVAAVLASVAKFAIEVASLSLKRIALKTSTVWDDVLMEALRESRYGVLYVWIFSQAIKPFHPPDYTHKPLLFIVTFVTVFQIGLWGLVVLKFWRGAFIDQRIAKDPSAAAALGLMFTVAKVVFFCTLILVGMSQLGIDITALLTGLGIGGIAVALAAQNVLGDLLASLSIVLDKPFVVGDFIVTGEQKGTVEHIGIKTTRVRSISGEELVFSNRDLLESRIRNFKRLKSRRGVQIIGVVYSTPSDVLEKIPGWIKAIVQTNPKLRLDSCQFVKYGSSSLDFELAFYVEDSDYNVFMDEQQKLLFEILRKFRTERVEFAYPSQSLFVERLPLA